MNSGHGHVFPRTDGVRARCGGPAFCRQCNADWQKAKAGLALRQTQIWHDHLDECEQCRDRPFDLCADGAVLLIGTEASVSSPG